MRPRCSRPGLRTRQHRRHPRPPGRLAPVQRHGHTDQRQRQRGAESATAMHAATAIVCRESWFASLRARRVSTCNSQRPTSKSHAASLALSSIGLHRLPQAAESGILAERIHLGIDVDGVEERRVFVEGPLDFLESLRSLTERIAGAPPRTARPHSPHHDDAGARRGWREPRRYDRAWRGRCLRARASTAGRRT